MKNKIISGCVVFVFGVCVTALGNNIMDVKELKVRYESVKELKCDIKSIKRFLSTGQKGDLESSCEKE